MTEIKDLSAVGIAPSELPSPSLAEEPANRSRIIIDCDPDALPAAYAVAMAELQEVRRYNRPGWGWAFNRDGRRFFVRGIKGGISVRQVRPAFDAEASSQSPDGSHGTDVAEREAQAVQPNKKATP